jgi:hypothetical protein
LIVRPDRILGYRSCATLARAFDSWLAWGCWRVWHVHRILFVIRVLGCDHNCHLAWRAVWLGLVVLWLADGWHHFAACNTLESLSVVVESLSLFGSYQRRIQSRASRDLDPQACVHIGECIVAIVVSVRAQMLDADTMHLLLRVDLGILLQHQQTIEQSGSAIHRWSVGWLLGIRVIAACRVRGFRARSSESASATPPP